MTVYNATPIEQEPVYDATPLGDKPESIDTSTWGATKSAANKVFSLDTLGSIGRGTGALAGTLVSFPASGIAGLGRLGYELSSGSGFENSMNKASETVESVMSLPAQAYLGALKPKGQAFDVMSLAPKANEITPEQQVVGIVGWPFEKLAELNKYISEGKADEPPSALRYALGAVPETVLYTVGLGTLAKYGMKPFDIKQKAKVFEQRLKVADEAKIPETVVSGEIRQPTTMSNVLSDKVLPPTTAQTRRRMRDIEGDLVKKQADQTQLTDMLQSQKEEAASGNVVIKPEDVTVQSLDSNTKLFVDNKVKELGSPEKVREVYNTDSPVDIYAREQAGKLEAPSVQKLNKGGLTPEELTKLSDTKVFLPEELAAIQKLPGFKQREQYNRVFNILPEIKADPVEIAKAEKLFGIVEENAKVRKSKVKDLNTLKKAEWSEADIAKMSEEDIAKKAKVIRGETNPLNPDGNTILKLKDAEIALNKFIEEVGGKSKLSELTDEQDARYEELVAKLRELDMDETFDPLHNVRDYLYLDEPVELQMEPGAFDARRDLLKGKAKPAPPQPGPAPIEAKTKRRRPVKMEDVEEVEHITNEDLSAVYEAKPIRSRAEELAAERAQRSGSAEDWEMALEAEGMPAELNFNAKLRRTRSQVEGERARTNVENALADIAKKRRVIRGAAEARNLLVDAYKYMPETEAEARTWAEKVKTLEDHVADKLGKRAAFTRKSIAEALAKKQITKQEAHYMNTIFNTLKQQPTMGFEFDPTMGEGREGLYTFANNLIRIKTPQALAHEVGHFAWYNVLTKEDKAAYMQDFINRYYKDGALDKSALRLATTDPFNAARNPNEMFACKFSDYMHEKVLSSTEMNLFQKVKQWFLGLKKRLGSEGTNYDGVEALFNKVLDPARRTMWSEDVGREFVEPTPGYTSDYSRIVPKHGTDIKELRDILKVGLKKGSALDTTREGAWAAESPITIEVPSAQLGEKVGHNDYYKSNNDAMPSRVTVDLDQYEHRYSLKVKEEINQLAQQYPNIKFEVKNDPGPYKPKYTEVDYENTSKELIELYNKENLELKKLKEELVSIQEPFKTEQGYYKNISREVKNRVEEIREDIKWYEKQDARAIRSLERKLDEMEKDVFPSEDVSDYMGVKSIRDRISMLTGLFEKAKVDHLGNKILGEVKDNDWGMATELMGRPILSLDNTTVSQRLWRNLGPWIESPMSFVKGTRNERHVYNTNLAEMFISHMYDQHKTLIDAIERGVRHGDGQRENIRKVIEGKIEGNPAEKEAAVQVRSWLDSMKARYKLFLINDYKANLSKSEYGALLDIISGDDLATVKSKYPRLATDVIEEIAAKHMEIDTWGLDNYIPNVEAGRYKILADGVTADGKPYQKLVAIGLSEKDAARKATKYLEENPEVSKLYVDTDYKMISDDKTSITSQQYYAMMHSLSKKMLESIDGIDKKVAKEMARKTLGRKFKIVPTDSYSPFLQDRADILKGEENIFPVLRSYAHSLEKKMALDPVIDIIRKDLPKMDKHERAYILDYIEDVKGKYGKADKMVDDIFHTYRGYSRLISRARTAEAALKLGYRPVAAAVNLASGQMHAWIKRGAPMYAEGIRFLHTEEGKQFIKDVEPFLGTSIIESGVDLKAKTPVYHPLGLFQMPEPLNRQVSVAAAYREAIKQGMSELAAKEFAIRANWAEQFTYNMANLPKIMRGPTGKLMTQFKPYLIKEIEFMSTLSGKEWLRYAGMQLALGGPRGYMMILKSLPILAAFGFWQEAMDIVEEWMNKNAPVASRGVGALPSLISPELGVDISAAATFQFPQGFWDFAGPALNDIGNIFTKVLKPLGTVGPYMEDVQKTGSIAPVVRHWTRLMDYTFSKDDWLRKENGDKLYEVKSAVPFIIQSIMGVENVDLNRIRAEQRILASRDERIGGIKTRLLNEAVNAIIAGKPIPESTRAKFGKYGITADSILGRIERAQLPPRARAILDAEVMQRRDAVEMFPTEEDFGQPLE